MRHRLALAALVVALAAPGPAAAFESGNLIVNGDAEGGPGATSSSETQPPPGWDGFGGATAVAYGAPDFPTTAQSQQLSGGKNFLAGGTGAQAQNNQVVALQLIDLTPFAAQIDRGDLTVTLKGLIGGYGGQEDKVQVTAALADANGTSGTGVVIGPVSDADRGGKTTLLQRSGCVAVPRNIRDAIVNLAFTRTAGAYVDGYVDNLSMTLADKPCPAQQVALEPATPPAPGVSGNATPVSGKVRIKLPNSNQYVELADASKIPVGSDIDATKGVVELQTAAGAGGLTQSGRFSDGAFKMTQPKSGTVTELKLSGTLNKCKKKRKGRVVAAAKTRRLWGDANGSFRTRGRNASASVRGTRWLTEDSCSGTLVRVLRGSVLVRDFKKRRNVTVNAGQRYLASP